MEYYLTTAKEDSTITYEKVLDACKLVSNMKPISFNYSAAADVFKRKIEFEQIGFKLNEEEKQYEYNGIIIKENKLLPDGMIIDMDELKRQVEVNLRIPMFKI